MATIVVPEETPGEAAEAENLASVAAAGSAAGIAAANADSAAQSADEAALLAANVENSAQRAEAAAGSAAGSAAVAEEASYATREQMESVSGTLGEIRELLIAKAQEPAPEPTKVPTPQKRDKPPSKPTHPLRRTWFKS